MAEHFTENIKKIVTCHIGPNDTIETVSIEPLTALGDHYLSTMLKVDVSLGSKRRLELVAKCVPENDFARPGFRDTFTAEEHFYSRIVPALQAFLREEGERELEIFPRFFGATVNGEDVDESSALVLENLKVSGYGIQDRLRGFDLDSARFILRDLAAFHAVPLALKLKKPDVFQEVIKDHSDFKIKLPPGEVNPFLNGIAVVCRILEKYPGIASSSPKIKSKLVSYAEDLSGRCALATEPFGTLSHFDMWMNNTMQKFENGKITGNKFVDFQMYLYESPTNDLLFFLLSSVERSVLDKHLNHLMEFYHANFIRTLQSLGCDVAPFRWEEFYAEVERVAEMELLHVLLMCFVIYADKSSVVPNQLPGSRGTEEDFCQEVKDRLGFIVKLCMERRWLRF